MLKRQSTRPNGPVLLTLALFAAASTLSACGGSAAPVQPIRGSGGATPTPKPTPTPVTAAPTPPPSGGVSVACVLTLASTGKTYAFVPANSATNAQEYPDSLAEVTIATGTTIAGSRRSAAQLAAPLPPSLRAIPAAWRAALRDDDGYRRFADHHLHALARGVRGRWDAR